MSLFIKKRSETTRLPDMVVIHSLSKAFTSLNSTAPARLGTCGLETEGKCGCEMEGPEVFTVFCTNSTCLKTKHRIYFPLFPTANLKKATQLPQPPKTDNIIKC